MQVRPTADGNNVDVEYDMSNAKLDAWAELHGAPAIIVATGFIAKDPKVRAPLPPHPPPPFSLPFPPLAGLAAWSGAKAVSPAQVHCGGSGAVTAGPTPRATGRARVTGLPDACAGHVSSVAPVPAEPASAGTRPGLLPAHFFFHIKLVSLLSQISVCLCSYGLRAAGAVAAGLRDDAEAQWQRLQRHHPGCAVPGRSHNHLD